MENSSQDESQNSSTSSRAQSIKTSKSKDKNEPPKGCIETFFIDYKITGTLI